MLESDYLDFTAPVPAETSEHWKPENNDQANWCLEKISEAKANIMDAQAFYEAKNGSWINGWKIRLPRITGIANISKRCSPDTPRKP